jgi:ABC-type thiamin/hydroxymethylpyrimidine transport system permease subunit
MPATQDEVARREFSTRDVVLIAIICAISAVVYAGSGQLWSALTAATGPLGGVLIAIFQFGHVLGGVLVPRRGVVFITSVLSTVIQSFLGDPAGLYVIGWGVTHGIGAELVFNLMGGYERPRFSVFAIAAGVAAVCGHIFSYFLYGWNAAFWMFMVSIPLLFIFSAIESGGLVYLVLQGLERAGMNPRSRRAPPPP